MPTQLLRGVESGLKSKGLMDFAPPGLGLGTHVQAVLAL
jgi:hypothetical protein